MENNLKEFAFQIGRQQRNEFFGHKSFVLWLTGLSGSGKSTIANQLNKVFHSKKMASFVLDGDSFRQGLCKDLGFSQDERSENLRRAAEVAKLFTEAGLICICSFISPLESQRQFAKEIIGAESFVEIYVNTPLSVCQDRDPKGLYKKSIENFSGIQSTYEEPISPDLVLKTDTCSVEEAVDQIMIYLQKHSLVV